jgi:hypothetical protein
MPFPARAYNAPDRRHVLRLFTAAPFGLAAAPAACVPGGDLPDPAAA